MKRSLVTVAAALLILVGVAMLALPKDWIESAVGFEPDGGNGMLELGLALVPLAAGLGLLALRYRAARGTTGTATGHPEG